MCKEQKYWEVPIQVTLNYETQQSVYTYNGQVRPQYVMGRSTQDCLLRIYSDEPNEFEQDEITLVPVEYRRISSLWHSEHWAYFFTLTFRALGSCGNMIIGHHHRLYKGLWHWYRCTVTIQLVQYGRKGNEPVALRSACVSNSTVVLFR